MKTKFISLLFILSACGSPVRELGSNISHKKFTMDDPATIDRKDPNLSKYISTGEEVNESLTTVILKSQDKKLKWKYSQKNSQNDTPPNFDCEGYVRYVYKNYLGHEPWKNLQSKELIDHAVGNAPALGIAPVYFKLITYRHAKRGDLVVYRKKEGYANDHVALFDGIVIKDEKMVPMVITTSTSASLNGEHVIQRMPLVYAVKAESKSTVPKPYFLTVLP